MKILRLIILPLLFVSFIGKAQSSYLVEQIGRNQHQIVQSLGAFVGNEHAESQAFDITFMPSGNNVEGVMIINTADYRATFRMDTRKEECFKIEIIIRKGPFLQEFLQLFQVYPTTGTEQLRQMKFGNRTLQIEEQSNPLRPLPRTYIITEIK